MEGFLNTKLESYIQGNINALKYFHALPKYLIPDNDKSAVTVANKYDPLNNLYQAMADRLWNMYYAYQNKETDR